MREREILERIFRAGVAACRPERVLPPALPEPPPGRTIVLAIGKAAAPMAEVVETGWAGPLSGLAVAPHGTAAALRRIELVTAAHPIPDEASVRAAERLLALAGAAGADDLVLVLLSGGASSLACLPNGVSLEKKREVTRRLLRSGAPIKEINCVRRHLSGIKGGRLAGAAQPARLVTLAISDVPGDAPHDIGSGPTVADPTTCDDARNILSAHRLAPPLSESVKPDAATAWDADYRIVAGAREAVDAAAQEAAGLGFRPVILGYRCGGEARTLAREHAGQALAALSRGERMALLSGGETNVTVSGCGSGGRNREYALALALALEGAQGISALAGDSDGIDGSGDAAGAFIDESTLARASAAGLDPAARLADNDSGRLFAAIGDALVTGPTGTNVSDLRILLVEPGARR
jgi:glycerate 2-kinase